MYKASFFLCSLFFILSLNYSFGQSNLETFLAKVEQIEYILIVKLTEQNDGRYHIEIADSKTTFEYSVDLENENITEAQLLAKILTEIYNHYGDSPKWIEHKEKERIFYYY